MQFDNQTSYILDGNWKLEVINGKEILLILEHGLQWFILMERIVILWPS